MTPKLFGWNEERKEYLKQCLKYVSQTTKSRDLPNALREEFLKRFPHCQLSGFTLYKYGTVLKKPSRSQRFPKVLKRNHSKVQIFRPNHNKPPNLPKPTVKRKPEISEMDNDISGYIANVLKNEGFDLDDENVSDNSDSDEKPQNYATFTNNNSAFNRNRDLSNSRSSISGINSDFNSDSIQSDSKSYFTNIGKENSNDSESKTEFLWDNEKREYLNHCVALHSEKPEKKMMFCIRAEFRKKYPECNLMGRTLYKYSLKTAKRVEKGIARRKSSKRIVWDDESDGYLVQCALNAYRENELLRKDSKKGQFTNILVEKFKEKYPERSVSAITHRLAKLRSENRIPIYHPTVSNQIAKKCDRKSSSRNLERQKSRTSESEVSFPASEYQNEQSNFFSEHFLDPRTSGSRTISQRQSESEVSFNASDYKNEPSHFYVDFDDNFQDFQVKSEGFYPDYEFEYDDIASTSMYNYKNSAIENARGYDSSGYWDEAKKEYLRKCVEIVGQNIERTREEMFSDLAVEFQKKYPGCQIKGVSLYNYHFKFNSNSPSFVKFKPLKKQTHHSPGILKTWDKEKRDYLTQCVDKVSQSKGKTRSEMFSDLTTLFQLKYPDSNLKGVTLYSYYLRFDPNKPRTSHYTFGNWHTEKKQYLKKCVEIVANNGVDRPSEEKFEELATEFKKKYPNCEIKGISLYTYYSKFNPFKTRIRLTGKHRGRAPFSPYEWTDESKEYLKKCVEEIADRKGRSKDELLVDLQTEYVKKYPDCRLKPTSLYHYYLKFNPSENAIKLKSQYIRKPRPNQWNAEKDAYLLECSSIAHQENEEALKAGRKPCYQSSLIRRFRLNYPGISGLYIQARASLLRKKYNLPRLHNRPVVWDDEKDNYLIECIARARKESKMAVENGLPRCFQISLAKHFSAKYPEVSTGYARSRVAELRRLNRLPNEICKRMKHNRHTNPFWNNEKDAYLAVCVSRAIKDNENFKPLKGKSGRQSVFKDSVVRYFKRKYPTAHGPSVYSRALIFRKRRLSKVEKNQETFDEGKKITRSSITNIKSEDPDCEVNHEKVIKNSESGTNLNQSNSKQMKNSPSNSQEQPNPMRGIKLNNFNQLNYQQIVENSSKSARANLNQSNCNQIVRNPSSKSHEKPTSESRDNSNQENRIEISENLPNKQEKSDSSDVSDIASDNASDRYSDSDSDDDRPNREKLIIKSENSSDSDTDSSKPNLKQKSIAIKSDRDSFISFVWDNEKLSFLKKCIEVVSEGKTTKGMLSLLRLLFCRKYPECKLEGKDLFEYGLEVSTDIWDDVIDFYLIHCVLSARLDHDKAKKEGKKHCQTTGTISYFRAKYPDISETEIKQRVVLLRSQNRIPKKPKIASQNGNQSSQKDKKKQSQQDKIYQKPGPLSKKIHQSRKDEQNSQNIKVMKQNHLPSKSVETCVSNKLDFKFDSPKELRISLAKISDEKLAKVQKKSRRTSLSENTNWKTENVSDSENDHYDDKISGNQSVKTWNLAEEIPSQKRNGQNTLWNAEKNAFLVKCSQIAGAENERNLELGLYEKRKRKGSFEALLTKHFLAKYPEFSERAVKSHLFYLRTKHKVAGIYNPSKALKNGSDIHDKNDISENRKFDGETSGKSTPAEHPSQKREKSFLHDEHSRNFSDDNSDGDNYDNFSEKSWKKGNNNRWNSPWDAEKDAFLAKCSQLASKELEENCRNGKSKWKGGFQANIVKHFSDRFPGFSQKSIIGHLYYLHNSGKIPGIYYPSKNFGTDCENSSDDESANKNKNINNKNIRKSDKTDASSGKVKMDDDESTGKIRIPKKHLHARFTWDKEKTDYLLKCFKIVKKTDVVKGPKMFQKLRMKFRQKYPECTVKGNTLYGYSQDILRTGEVRICDENPTEWDIEKDNFLVDCALLASLDDEHNKQQGYRPCFQLSVLKRFGAKYPNIPKRHVLSRIYVLRNHGRIPRYRTGGTAKLSQIICEALNQETTSKNTDDRENIATNDRTSNSEKKRKQKPDSESEDNAEPTKRKRSTSKVDITNFQENFQDENFQDENFQDENFQDANSYVDNDNVSDNSEDENVSHRSSTKFMWDEEKDAYLLECSKLAWEDDERALKAGQRSCYQRCLIKRFKAKYPKSNSVTNRSTLVRKRHNLTIEHNRPVVWDDEKDAYLIKCSALARKDSEKAVKEGKPRCYQPSLCKRFFAKYPEISPSYVRARITKLRKANRVPNEPYNQLYRKPWKLTSSTPNTSDNEANKSQIKPTSDNKSEKLRSTSDNRRVSIFDDEKNAFLVECCKQVFEESERKLAENDEKRLGKSSFDPELLYELFSTRYPGINERTVKRQAWALRKKYNISSSQYQIEKNYTNTGNQESNCCDSSSVSKNPVKRLRQMSETESEVIGSVVSGNSEIDTESVITNIKEEELDIKQEPQDCYVSDQDEITERNSIEDNFIYVSKVQGNYLSEEHKTDCEVGSVENEVDEASNLENKAMSKEKPIILQTVFDDEQSDDEYSDDEVEAEQLNDDTSLGNEPTDLQLDFSFDESSGSNNEQLSEVTNFEKETDFQDKLYVEPTSVTVNNEENSSTDEQPNEVSTEQLNEESNLEIETTDLQTNLTDNETSLEVDEGNEVTNEETEGTNEMKKVEADQLNVTNMESEQTYLQIKANIQQTSVNEVNKTSSKESNEVTTKLPNEAMKIKNEQQTNNKLKTERLSEKIDKSNLKPVSNDPVTINIEDSLSDNSNTSNDDLVFTININRDVNSGI